LLSGDIYYWYCTILEPLTSSRATGASAWQNNVQESDDTTDKTKTNQQDSRNER